MLSKNEIEWESMMSQMNKTQKFAPVQKVFTASVESISQSDLYLTVKARLFTAPNANLNGCRCTEAFLDEIVANQNKYIGLPLSADVSNLCDGNYKKLGHMYNPDTGEFHSTMIGSFYQFQKEQLNSEETALIGYARVLKRNAKVCAAVCDLFASGNLSFSFEVSCGEYTELQDGTILIDASEKNSWEGQAIVWSPACPDAVALDLVAELVGLEEGDENMTDVKTDNEVVVASENKDATEEEIEKEETVAETTPVEEEKNEETEEETAKCNKECADEETAKCKEPCAEEEDASCKKECGEEQTAENKEQETDEESDKADPEQNPTEDEKPEEDEQNAACKKECAENEVAEMPMTAEPVHVEQTHVEKDIVNVYSNEGCVHEETEHIITVCKDMIAELKTEISELRNRVAELESEKKTEVIASKEVVTMNPFMDNISNAHKYSLLEKETKKFNSYSLLEKY